MECSTQMARYLFELKGKFDSAYEIANRARAMGKDAASAVEITPAEDVASRVEGLVGPPEIAKRIRELNEEGKSREEAVIAIADEILEGKWPVKSLCGATDEREIKIEQAVRTGLALYTEGVVSAPLEGVTRLKIKRNVDNSEFVSVYFSGPIRGAGGTGQAFTLLLADYCRAKMGITQYRPIDAEVARYVEETNLYALRTRAGQYAPTEDEVRHIARNCPVCVDGEPTEEYDVSVNKNVPNVESNRVRGGMVLVISEGLCLKAAKILQISRKFPGVDWSWIEKLIKVAKTDATQKVEIKPNDKYLKDIVAGRPIFSYPMTPGGFTLRYGRTPLTGIAAKAIHPATMIILDEFPAIGTQVKLERPGKACIVTPCEDIDGPLVRLRNGDVLRIYSSEQAQQLRGEVEKILFLGDLLVNYGDFSKSNHPLVPSAWCNEWFAAELKKKGIEKTPGQLREITFEENLQLCKQGLPLAPRFTLFWHDLTVEQTKQLGEWIATSGKIENENLELPLEKEGKNLLEAVGCSHNVREGKIVIEKNEARALLFPLGLIDSIDSSGAAKLSTSNLLTAVNESGVNSNGLNVVRRASGFEIRHRAGTYIGASMGRPEKSKERKMEPPVHGLFPLGVNAGKTRGIAKAASVVRQNGGKMIQVDVAIRMCPGCKVKTPLYKCPACSKNTIMANQCKKCGLLCVSENCPKCKIPAQSHEVQALDLLAMLENAAKTTRYSGETKGVIGLISSSKSFEPLEKALLRAKHGTYVFRDGTCRVDATEIPITHFKPGEIETSIEKLKELGYEFDEKGNPLENESQVVELKPQDIIVTQREADYLVKVSNFIDDLLVYYYGMPSEYDAKNRSDLIGQLAICIAPHISAGMTARIIGFTNARALLAHPYMHCACRRNSDGDELSYMLLLDALLNFSREFLPSTRGGQMDAPLVLSSQLNPSEVDDEVHAMDVCAEYPLELFEATQLNSPPKSVKIETVASRLGKATQFENLRYTHSATLAAPVESSYVKPKDMYEKVEMELTLMEKIRAVNAAAGAERIILSHFFPDLYGNLRSFGKQIFRCVDCNAKFRRVPLVGKCAKCGGKLLLTINRGGIEKYLAMSKQLAERFHMPLYLKQRLQLVERDIQSIFEDDKSKQFSLAEFA